MRIGIDFRMAGIENGGLGRYVFELTRALLAADAVNEYFLFCRDPEQAKTLSGYKNVQIVRADYRHYSISEQIFFPRTLNRYKLDLVHFPNFNVPILYKRRFIVTIHDLIHHKIGGVKKTNWAHFWAYKKVIENAAKNSEAIITVSECSKQDIIEDLKVIPSKVKVIYEGISLRPPVDESKIAQTKAKYFLEKPYFMFVGVLQRNKNLQALVEGFADFQKKIGDSFHLLIVGKADPHYPNIKTQCLLSSAAQDLAFVGAVDDEDLKALYAGAQGFVSASVLEGFGLPGLEAAAFGVPLAVSNIQVFNEIYENAAIYFNPKNPTEISQCLKLLSMDEKYHAQVSENARKRALFFNWQKCAAETLQVYKSVIN